MAVKTKESITCNKFIKEPSWGKGVYLNNYGFPTETQER